MPPDFPIMALYWTCFRTIELEQSCCLKRTPYRSWLLSCPTCSPTHFRVPPAVIGGPPSAIGFWIGAFPVLGWLVLWGACRAARPPLSGP